MFLFVRLYNMCRNRGYLLTVLVQLGSDPTLIQFFHGMSNERVMVLGSYEQCQPCIVEKRCVLGRNGSYQHYPDIVMVSSTSWIWENLVSVRKRGCCPIPPSLSLPPSLFLFSFPLSLSFSLSLPSPSLSLSPFLLASFDG